jgi:outer membrane receptor protein involved in Fe transport
MNREFASGQTAAFVQVDGSIGSRWKLLAGLRAETFSIIGRYALNPRFSIAYRLSKHQSIHASAGEASQLPSTMNLLSYPENHGLRPTQVRQAAAGIRLVQANWGTLDAEAYEKHYRYEAVSTEYPQLMLSNMIDTLGQWFVWLPLTSAGSATSRGLEITLRAQVHGRVRMLTSATYSRTSYRAVDGVRRRGNYDYPLVANTIGTVRLLRGFELSARETYSSGHPYTPYNLPESYAQNRGIYDLRGVNSQRGPFYNRLDLEIMKKFRVGKGMLDLHGGADNVFNRHNLLGYVWLQNCQFTPECTSVQTPVQLVPQMGLFPALAVRYQF